jgi:hypothetical protein
LNRAISGLPSLQPRSLTLLSSPASIEYSGQ